MFRVLVFLYRTIVPLINLILAMLDFNSDILTDFLRAIRKFFRKKTHKFKEMS